MMPKSQATKQKINKHLRLHQIKRFLNSNRSYLQRKKQMKGWKKFTNLIFDRD